MPTATAPARPTRARRAATTTPRRVSGAARGAAVARRAPSSTGQGSVAVAPLGLRLARRARALPDASLLERLMRGRLWIGVLAALLLGIVFLQVSLLKLNTGIGHAVQTSSALELQNADLRRQLTQTDGGEQLQELAGAKGMVMPAPGDVGYVSAAGVDPAAAVANITTPGDVSAAAAPSATPAVTGTAAAVDPTTEATPAPAPAPTASTAAPAASAAAPAASTAEPAAATAAAPVG